MSQQADIQRTRRQKFAAPGSSHDTVVRFLRNALPMGVGLLAAILVATPLINRPEFSFVLSKDEVDVARERLRVAEAMYRGEDSKGHPFSIRAGSAVQRSSREPVLRLTDLSGRILMTDGPAAIRARKGQYDMDGEVLSIAGPLQFDSAGGYNLVVNDVVVSFKDRTLQSRGDVRGSTNIGSFSADRLRADLESRTVTLQGNAKLRIDQSR